MIFLQTPKAAEPVHAKHKIIMEYNVLFFILFDTMLHMKMFSSRIHTKGWCAKQ